jgi:riboflavin synthase alpha subunit
MNLFSVKTVLPILVLFMDIFGGSLTVKSQNLFEKNEFYVNPTFKENIDRTILETMDPETRTNLELAKNTRKVLKQ